MTLRDVSEITREIVLPALERVVQPGELDEIRMWREPAHPARGEHGQLPATVQLTVILRGETFHDTVYDESSGPAAGDPALVERLASNLQDFIAESTFGWGTNRELR